MRKKNLIIIGNGGHTRSCLDIIKQDNKFKISGFVIDQKKSFSINEKKHILGFDKDLKELRNKYCHAFIGIGQIKSPNIRFKLFKRLKKLNFKLPTFISRNAVVSPSVKIGEGTIIMNGAIINAGAIIGDNCIVNSKALVEHDVVIKNHCHISTNATLNGQVKIGSNCFIGSGSIIKQELVIRNNSIISLGSIIKKSN